MSPRRLRASALLTFSYILSLSQEHAIEPTDHACDEFDDSTCLLNAAVVRPSDVAKWTPDDVASQADRTVRQLIQNYDVFLFDCDGTLYHEKAAIPFVNQVIRLLRKLGKKVFFVTNTSSRSSKQLQAKLAELGISAEENECVPSGVFTAAFISKQADELRTSTQGATSQSHSRRSAKFYVVGGQGVVDELRGHGLDGFGGPDDSLKLVDNSKFQDLVDSTAAEGFNGVVVGWDQEFNYYKVVKSSIVFQTNPDALFYATNDDPADKLPGGLLVGNGPLLNAIEAACVAVAPWRISRPEPYGCKARVMGKPNPLYAKFVAEENGIELSKTVMVGDRLDTDIYMGVRATQEYHTPMGTLFVLTGVHDLSELNARDIKSKGILPTFVLPAVTSIYEVICLGENPLPECEGI
eukprot:TRINITY_DN19192_c0_g1_i1.p1 TRINITY_DN19192_c0_g1~~TRINITY_DN19192_c0_g1_i1.p1  ORF type:complete len:409 (-),score=68.62 TRINITY_DN19192_c0_g1_i1:153-1379(-)